MKVVKLNNNFNIYKYHRFEIGLRFNIYGADAQSISKTAQRLFGSEAFMWKYTAGKPVKGDWATGFGKRDSSAGATSYWIYLRKESMLSLILLSLEHNNG